MLMQKGAYTHWFLQTRGRQLGCQTHLFGQPPNKKSSASGGSFAPPKSTTRSTKMEARREKYLSHADRQSGSADTPTGRAGRRISQTVNPQFATQPYLIKNMFGDLLLESLLFTTFKLNRNRNAKLALLSVHFLPGSRKLNANSQSYSHAYI